MSQQTAKIQFSPFISDIELPFYASLASLKLNHDKLDDSARKVLGLYEIRPLDPPQASCRIQVHGNALLSDEVPPGYYKAEGVIKNVNTAEEYYNINRSELLQQAAKRIWDAINDGSIYSYPSLLASFTIHSFADLKKYRFLYWFAFPALHSNPSWALENLGKLYNGPEDGAEQYSQPLTGIENDALVDAVQAWRHGTDTSQHGFFLAKKRWYSTRTRKEFETSGSERGMDRSNSPQRPEELEYEWVVSPLSGYEDGFFETVPERNRFVCFADPSNYADAPGWMLRNLLVLVQQRWKLNSVQILRYCDKKSKKGQLGSSWMILTADSMPIPSAGVSDIAQAPIPKVTGWERNSSGKLSGRMVNLAEYMDPQRIAEQSVDLNLKLMKWRISPNLDLESVRRTRCLLLGAGTLGCYVARNLLGWGVRTITFVDNGSVSFSNPVRQPLFNFKDCQEGGAKKAVRAAEALREIYPGVESSGHVLSVPMAGHPIVDNDKAKSDFESLRDLIDSHDAIFLLMDTRESRWLPTVMGKATGKIVMNAALGFDTFVAMRHGFRNPEAPLSSSLGCYFCNDVVAPGNSVKMQTLDQQCTVTRPGIATMASASLVELFVSILQHPNRAGAPASKQDEIEPEHPLGDVPHQIRGFLRNFSTVNVSGPSYEYCSACSNTIVDAYMKDGWNFIRRALSENGYIEELSGLKRVQQLAEEAIASLELEDEFLADDEPELI